MQTAKTDLGVLCITGFLRSIATGMVGVILGIFLFRHGADSIEIGVATAAGLAGAALATAVVTIAADRQGRRRSLTLLSLLWVLGGIGLAYAHAYWLVLVVAFVGMVNAMGTDRSAAYVLEQAALPGLVRPERRTWTFAWYHLALDGGGALGALGAGLPIALTKWSSLDLDHAYRDVWLGYAALGIASATLYRLASDRLEVPTAEQPQLRQPLSEESKGRVYRIAALFAIDSFGGGFLTDAVVAYWFFRRFGLGEQQLGILFFAVHVLNALSHLGAAWLAKRIGLLRTMVFTHLPSSIFLIAVPFAPSFRLAAALFLARESLVEMDVPTRQSYVSAIVRPHERTFAAGVTNLSRNVFWAIAAAIGGVLMQNVAFAAPLVAGGGLKIGYDLLLYRKFRNIKPPEESAAPEDQSS